MPRRLFANLLATAMISIGALHLTALADDTTDGKHFTQVPEIAPAAGQPEPKAEPAAKKSINEGPAPVWIWGADANKKYFVRKTFKGSAQFVRLRATCDDVMTIYVNGKMVASQGPS